MVLYKEVVSIHDTSRLREFVDPNSEYFTDAQLSNILAICSGVLDRAVVKCLLGIQQQAKEKKDGKKVLEARLLLDRFESGLIEI